MKRKGLSATEGAVVVAAIVLVAVAGYVDLGSSGGARGNPSLVASSSIAATETASVPSLTKGPGRLIETFTSGVPIFSSEMTINYTLAITSIGATPAGSMALEIAGPPGLNLSVAPANFTPGSAPLDATISARPAANLAPGSYDVTINATGGGAYYTETAEVQVVKYLVVTIGTSFVPQNLTVPAGSTVTWLRLNGPISQYDDGTHNVDFGSAGIPTSPPLAQFESWTYTFTQPGTYPYVCDYHPWQTGTIIVTPSA